MNIELFYNFFILFQAMSKLVEAEWQRHSTAIGIPLPKLTHQWVYIVDIFIFKVLYVVCSHLICSGSHLICRICSGSHLICRLCSVSHLICRGSRMNIKYIRALYIGVGDYIFHSEYAALHIRFEIFLE
jgi:hypothetical protein